MLHLSHILVGLNQLNFRDWKPVKNTIHWNISGIYANVGKFFEPITRQLPPAGKCRRFLQDQSSRRKKQAAATRKNKSLCSHVFMVNLIHTIYIKLA